MQVFKNIASHPRTSAMGILMLLAGVIAVVLDAMHGVGVQAAVQAHWVDLAAGLGLLTAADSAQVPAAPTS